MALEDKIQTRYDSKPDMGRYDHLGLVGQLNKLEEDQMYILGAMDDFGDKLEEDGLREFYKTLLRSKSESGEGLEHAVGILSKKYQDNRRRTTLGDFCKIYSVNDYTKDLLKNYFTETIGEIMDKIKDWKYITDDPKNHFTKEQKEEAKKKIEEYGKVIREIKFAEDKRFVQLKEKAIERTKQIMHEAEKKQESQYGFPMAT